MTSPIQLRRSHERGQADHGWLRSFHSFSFADYHDPQHQHFRHLRVINEDWIAPNRGFGMHPHRSMEIFTYVVSGQLRHEDSMGNARTIEAGEFQYMSAGDGVLHSEFNPSTTEETHLLQIWIMPAQAGGEPRYQDLNLNALPPDTALTPLAYPQTESNEGQIGMRQNAAIFSGKWTQGSSSTLYSPVNRPFTWLQLINGTLQVDDQILEAGDAASFNQAACHITALSDAHFLLFQLS